jgi:hypothetical protein
LKTKRGERTEKKRGERIISLTDHLFVGVWVSIVSFPLPVSGLLGLNRCIFLAFSGLDGDCVEKNDNQHTHKPTAPF